MSLLGCFVSIMAVLCPVGVQNDTFLPHPKNLS